VSEHGAEAFIGNDGALVDMADFIKFSVGQGDALMAYLHAAIEIVIDYDFLALQARRIVTRL
jgi:hypothetical protein